MRKILIILLSFSFSILAFCQNDIQKDTSLANAYINQAINSENEERKVELFEKAIVIYKQYHFFDKVIKAKGELANLFVNSDVERCVSIATEAIELSKKHYPDALDTNLLETYLALQVAYANRIYDKSIFYGELAYQLTKKPSTEHFIVLEALILNYSNLKQHDKAQQLTDEFKSSLEELSDSSLLGYWAMFYKIEMQNAYFSLNHEKTILYGNKFLATNDKYQLFIEEQTTLAFVYLSNAYQGLQQFAPAVQFHEKANEIIAKVYPNTPILGTYYVSIAALYRNMNNIQKSIESYEKGIQLMLKDKENYNNALVATYQNLATTQILAEDYEKAEVTIQAAYEFSDVFYLDATYGNILMKRQEYTKALQYFQRALTKLGKHYLDSNIVHIPNEFEAFADNSWVGSILYYKAAAFYSLGKQEESEKWLKLGIEHAENAATWMSKTERQLEGFEDSKMRLRFNSNISRNINLLLDLYHQLYELNGDTTLLKHIFHISEKDKALNLLETITTKELPESYLIREKALSKKMKNYEHKAISAREDSLVYFQDLYFDAVLEMEDFLAEIKAKFPKETFSIYNIEYVKYQEIQKNLDDKTILVEYNSTKNNIYAYLISKNQVIIKRLNDEDKSIAEVIREFNQLLENPFLTQTANRNRFIDISNELYKVLIAPIEVSLREKTKLIIIPEGDLFYLPFETLLATNEKKPFAKLNFLIKKYEISYQYSATIYHQLKQKPAIKDKSLLAFAPVFDKGLSLKTASRSFDFMVDSLYTSIDNNEFIKLPNTAKEVEEIGKTIRKNKGKATILLRAEANKKQLQDELKKQYQFIHLATHGFVNFKNPKLSALACFENEIAEDVLIFANEIQMQDIRADLVILSSCESGIGQLVSGEGLLALNRSFIYAGANNVMFSLWKVNDEYTSELMIDFYQSYFKTQSYTAALRQAKLKMLENPTTANPRYWAAFVLIGE